jgi:hypothetical protein
MPALAVTEAVMEPRRLRGQWDVEEYGGIVATSALRSPNMGLISKSGQYEPAEQKQVL